MSTQYRPITAITMGDPAGIGPEIVVGTMLSEEIHDCCRPFVIGSIAIMERAAKVLGKELKYNKIEDPSEAKYEFGTVDIIETGDYDTDSIEWGKVQALAGQMAVDWIMKSIELGEAGKIDAVSTAPIHKGAIKLIGVKEPGHTEIYQNVTHSPYALTMFSCHKLRVFFVSRHAGLGTIISQVLEQVGREKVAGLYTTGGDTMVNVCYQLGVECIEVMDYVIPQTDVGRLVGKYDGLPVVGKGGLTGNDNTACDIVERLFKESAR